MLEVPEDIKKLGSYFLTGSRVICNPPVLDTDLDVVVRVDLPTCKYDRNVIDDLIEAGWISSNYGYGSHGDFHSMRKLDINVILVFSDRLYEAWQYATGVATKLNVTDKADRANLFGIIKQYYK